MLRGIERDIARKACWQLTQLCDQFPQVLVMHSRSQRNGAFVFDVIRA